MIVYKVLACIFVFTVAIYMIAEANSTPLKKTRKYLYKISDACEGLNIYLVNHSLEENKEQVASISKKASDHMRSMKKHVDRLPDSEEAKIPLQQFIANWDEQKIETSLINGDARFPSDLGYLKSLIPDKRKRWKTPFPIYRP
jgi:hypothetical protein